MRRLNMRNIQNERAKFAYDKVCEIDGISEQKEFTTLARSTPAKIQMAGLGVTIAFLYSKKEDAHKKLYDIVEGWLKTQKIIENEDELMKAITESSTGKYQAMTVEVQQLLMWVKRFAEGMKKDEKPQ